MCTGTYLQTTRGFSVSEFSKYRLTEIRGMAPDVNVYRFEPLEGEVPDYRPGHFAFLHLLDEQGNTVVKRPYSIASSPDMPYLEFCIKLVGGELTGRLEKLEQGGVVGIGRPGGHMTYGEEERSGFIAGGTGISPIISMLRHIAAQGKKGDFIFFYSARRKENILYHEELKRLQQKNPSIRVLVTLTREERQWGGLTGRLCKVIIEKYAENAGQYRWYLCGPTGMIKAMKNCLVELGTGPSSIRMEGWG
ncbi:hypothetical protein GF318_05675 [Candidatus Micrarchaeota archaeon]|nr:hypothetical protein [Candidatus Micrarchaeota archaeon]